ncbi:MAG: hypothetical protein WC135_07250 [Bacteroidales bacterium]|jgi:hypothetical protein
MGKNENKNEKFKRIALSRTNKIIDMIDLLGNLSNKSNYDYTDEEVDKMFRAIEASLRNAKSKFSSTTYPKRKKFEF